jgi:hypothetical protein
MNNELHTAIAWEHYRIAEAYDIGADIDRRVRMIVAAQNYFYAIVHSIEADLAGFNEHSFSHENRLRRVLEHRSRFGDEVVRLYELVERDGRNRVAYRGENGARYHNIKKLAQLIIRDGSRE